ncbi:dTDP-glucose 4,6-dehydratase [Mesotoga sp. BH458_6_3_2_1]|uniref:dTDP-glucose 4,6-dehydratase n=1 Tax=Mesotoga sp. BH458_6_3_2_1 TaxID=1437446 RepID=UPI0002CA2CC7|nr:GDP-mannose 4,6-dehydratase [Mesotoga sp. BH458_6_3_2_1]RLL85662.1 NAD-dependent dehydratase [Mesotoga sp. BH458_6_3_2_1]CCU83512.1 Nucleoside-diphosphate-sugar epimerase [Mesotoga infera]
MKTLVTGGAGFIGRWLVKRLLDEGHSVNAIDDFSNGRRENIEEFFQRGSFHFLEGDIRNERTLEKLFEEEYDIVYHLAAEINVQNSIDNPSQTIERDILGTFNILEHCRKQKTRVVFMSTCMVYDRSYDESGITEEHPTKPASPYAAAKLSGEALTLSYFHAYGLPTAVIRPFNTYGPFQKTNGEGGVVAIFVKQALKNEPLRIYGDGTQTRDLLYVEDCVDFIIRAGNNDLALGQIINAGTGNDVAINNLALMIAGTSKLIKHVPHIHPQAEIMKLKCNSSKARDLLGWEPKFSLEKGIEKTKKWIESNPEL